ncbi:differentially expressed in FDCP 8 homolog [Varroa destructor]|uniref:Phorbol-ester/DAG-type domain-containing protein n=1 Tax=Varroa destructor TaxID=109461 RepID=A0A7M7KPU2_VARDE|nr:differentially expressed in FDCP 8 homolog [Varroa destructor]XP_022669016.1 differentially expressed in FDCP 8 homolog [Varroa destructor]XP_022669017.1 differentially expressed in FDCP 8 homolog [Varroa destructor]XP_022669018.1 differentially expressed in FDCP 8 homolog [Varroa destructor]
MNTFGISEFAGKLGDMVKTTLTGEGTSRASDSPPPPATQTNLTGCSPQSMFSINEEHFAGLEGIFSSINTESELELAIEKCKQMILDSEEHSDKRYNLIGKLIDLRWKLQEMRHGPQTPSLEESFTIMGHVFVSCSLEDSDSFCEKCCTRIWDFVNIGINQYYTCDKCRYKCHQRCLNSITRSCAYLKEHKYELQLCPEMGLSVQQFKCQECRSSLMPPGPLRLLPQMEAARRLCDSCGRWFCNRCHWNTEVVIPARVVHNWDFEPRKVCRGCVQFLRLMVKRSVLDIEKLNPYLFSHIEELSAVKTLREDLQKMKKYLTSCHIAQSKKLLWLLWKRQHFVENTNMYSMQDLIDLEQGTLLKFLHQVINAFEAHITKECEGCRKKGFICELCSSTEILFPIHRDSTTRCPKCLSVFHHDCFRKFEGFCPKCDRMTRRGS